MDNPIGFGPSHSSCPKLRSFVSYMLQGLDLGGIGPSATHKLTLPCCHHLSLYCAYDLDSIVVDAPELWELDLQVKYCSRPDAYDLQCM